MTITIYQQIIFFPYIPSLNSLYILFINITSLSSPYPVFLFSDVLFLTGPSQATRRGFSSNFRLRILIYREISSRVSIS